MPLPQPMCCSFFNQVPSVLDKRVRTVNLFFLPDRQSKKGENKSFFLSLLTSSKKVSYFFIDPLKQKYSSDSLFTIYVLSFCGTNVPSSRAHSARNRTGSASIPASKKATSFGDTKDVFINNFQKAHTLFK